MVGVVKRYCGILLKTASLVAFFILVVCLVLSPHELSGAWSRSAIKYLLAYLCVSLGLLGFIRLLVPNKQNLALVICSGVFLVMAAGVLQLLAIVFVLLSCFCLGILTRHFLGFDRGQPHFSVSTIIGSTIYVLLFNSCLSLSIHYQFVYLVIFSLPIVVILRLPTVSDLLFSEIRLYVARINTELQLAEPRIFFGFMLVFTFIAAYILFPTINSDENAVHLSVWTQFSANAFFSIAPEIQVWSAAPVTLALIHGVLSLLSGDDAKGALNLLLLVMLLGTIFRLLKILDISRIEKLALVTLFLSTPMVAFTLVGLQTDLFLALLFSIACMLLIDLLCHFRISTAVSIIFVGAIALSAKLPAITIAGSIFIGVIYAAFKDKSYQNWTSSLWLKIMVCLCIAAAVAFLPYIRAYLITGNPVFPLYNEMFKSQFFDLTNFKDLRWYNGASFLSFYGLFFHSEKFIEAANNFVGGFQYFLLAPIALASVIFLRIKSLGVIVVMALCYLLPMFWSLQYLRYFFAAMPLLAVVIGALYLLGKKEGIYRKCLTISFYGAALLNLVFMPGVSWIFFNSPFQFLSASNQRQAILEYLPEHQLNKEINSIKSNAIVLFALDRSFGATLAGKPIYNSFYANDYKKAINTWKTTDDVRNALKAWGVDFVYWDQKQSYSVDHIQRNLVREVLINYGNPVVQVGQIVAFTVADSPIAYQTLFSYHKFTVLDDFNLMGTPQIEMESIKIGQQDLLINRSISVHLDILNIQ